MSYLNQFLSGAVCMGYVVAGMFFLKFWLRARDIFFIFFASAFFIFAFVRITLSVMAQDSEYRTFLYLGRALAVLLIVVAIIQKNRMRKTGSPPLSVASPPG